ncbi:glycosyltransferase [Cytobacillus praedii]|uniref:Glycosyltransferase n=1 Tax=Cytobacillus praedii TaxID=1742358 RepID=A0A4R1B1T0_9BACI|nr:glycosyltransferase [Cytobacillus praedii]TCJ06385.1 glycosyltransferase [Cytobacillus praedii]
MKEKTISLCMIIKNEEKVLSDCLRSVKGKVNEIIVVDTGSTDSSVGIAESYGAKVFYFDWVDDFSSARNFSLSKATSDYILVLDADEQLDQSFNLYEEIKSDKDYYIMSIKNRMGKEYVLNHNAIRLFKNDHRLKYKGRIHEHININEYNTLTFETINEPQIYHIGYIPEVFSNKNKNKRNLNMLKMAVKEDPSGYNYYNLGKQFKAIGDFDSAFNAFSKSFSLNNQVSYIPNLLYHMGECLNELQKYEDGIHLVKTSISKFPEAVDLFFILGVLYENAGYIQDAELCFRKCIEIGDLEFGETLEGVGSYLAFFKLGEVLRKQGRILDAFEFVLVTLKQRKHFSPGLALALSLMDQSNIPLQNKIEFIERTYKIENVEDLQVVLAVSHALRSSMLDELLLKYNVEIEYESNCVAKQYSKQYTVARDLWMQADRINYEYGIDIFILALIIKDTELLNKSKNVLNVNKSEWKTLIQIVNRDNENIKITNRIKEILVYSLDKIFNLREASVQNYLLEILENENDVRKEIIKLLDGSGQSELAMNLLEKWIHKNEGNSHYLGMFGDKVFKNGCIEKSLKIYKQSFNNNPTYLNYYRLIRLYEITKQTLEKEKMIKDMYKNYPSSLWCESKMEEIGSL